MDRSVIYHILHLSGILLLFLSYGGLMGRAMAGSDKPGLKKFASITGGIALLAIIVGGFGLMARMGYSIKAPWIWVKIGVWVCLAAMNALINRQPKLAGVWWWLTWILGAVAVTAVYLHPYVDFL
ncbi:MAG: hypothetical protein E1N59_523 [Puniceicoccaceae bacterium 5H]|nr:MAG: hypothetical protein E1N59_523 [Puniceicoccaceae bacterium 5H]